MIVPVKCLVLECTICHAPMDDLSDAGEEHEDGLLLHFASHLEIVTHLGGVHDGRIYPGTGRSGGVLTPDGLYYCYACKLDPHLHIPGELIDSVCGRCGRLAGEHPTTLPADREPTRQLQPSRRQQRRGLTPRQGSCEYDCRHGHQYPPGGPSEPDDGSRIEFVFATDRYAAWRDAESSLLAGWPAAMSWTIYPGSTGHTWWCMQRTFGPALNGAILLAPAGVLRAAAHG